MRIACGVVLVVILVSAQHFLFLFADVAERRFRVLLLRIEILLGFALSFSVKMDGYHERSRRLVTPDLVAQWSQQNICSPLSRP